MKKGAGNEAEDFSRATVSLFVTSDRNRWAVPCRAGFAGIVRAELPELLPEGVYSLELVWVKNDKYLGMRCLQRTRKVCVFAVSDGVALPQGVTQGEPVLLRMSTVAAPYGYDGLSAYELCVLRGKTLLSEEEWCDRLCNNQGTPDMPDNPDVPDVPDVPDEPSWPTLTGTLSGGGNKGYGHPVTLTWTASQTPKKVVIMSGDGWKDENNSPYASSGNVKVTPDASSVYSLYLNGASSPVASTTVKLFFPVYIGVVDKGFSPNTPDLSKLEGWALSTFGPCEGKHTFRTDDGMYKMCVAVPQGLNIEVSILGLSYLTDMIKVEGVRYTDPKSGKTAVYTVYTQKNTSYVNGAYVDYKVTE